MRIEKVYHDPRAPAQAPRRLEIVWKSTAVGLSSKETNKSGTKTTKQRGNAAKQE